MQTSYDQKTLRRLRKNAVLDALEELEARASYSPQEISPYGAHQITYAIWRRPSKHKGVFSFGDEVEVPDGLTRTVSNLLAELEEEDKVTRDRFMDHATEVHTWKLRQRPCWAEPLRVNATKVTF